MSKFKILPIKTEVARAIRETMIDQEGHQLFVSIGNEKGYGPCRSCLKQFVAGEQRIVFSYSPNPVDHAYNETGPVYIHAEACEPYQETGAFPPEVENGRIKFPLVFRAYNEKGVMIDALLQNGMNASSTIESIFENSKVAFAHVRNAQFVALSRTLIAPKRTKAYEIRVAELHRSADENCFIVNSVKTKMSIVQF